MALENYGARFGKGDGGGGRWDLRYGIVDWRLRIGEFWDFGLPILDFGFLHGEFGMQGAEDLKPEGGWRCASHGRPGGVT